MLASDRSTTIRSSLHDTERTLLIAVGLVILVVFAVPARRPRHPDPDGRGAGLDRSALSRAMYLLGYSLTFSR